MNGWEYGQVPRATFVQFAPYRHGGLRVEGASGFGAVFAGTENARKHRHQDTRSRHDLPDATPLAAGLTCAFTQSLLAQLSPSSHGSTLSTTPLSGVATGLGCVYRHSAFVHLRPNLHNDGDCGRSGGAKPGVEGCDACAAGVGVGAAKVVEADVAVEALAFS